MAEPVCIGTRGKSTIRRRLVKKNRRTPKSDSPKFPALVKPPVSVISVCKRQRENPKFPERADSSCLQKDFQRERERERNRSSMRFL